MPAGIGLTSPVVTDTIASSSSGGRRRRRPSASEGLPDAQHPEGEEIGVAAPAGDVDDLCRQLARRRRVARLERPEASRDEQVATRGASRPDLVDEPLGSRQPARCSWPSRRGARGPGRARRRTARPARGHRRRGTRGVPAPTRRALASSSPTRWAATARRSRSSPPSGAAASSSSYASRHERRSNASRPSSTRVVTADSLAASPRAHGSLSRQTLGHAEPDPRHVQPDAVHRAAPSPSRSPAASPTAPAPSGCPSA